jgi:secondary thiamine-phosphate synthase enzyme
VALQARHEEFSLDTQGDGDIVDITPHAQKVIANAGFSDGLCTVFVAHTTCAVSIIEHEPGCDADLNGIFERLAPQDAPWEHNALNHDTNGHSHARAGILGPSMTVPFSNGELMLGTWQKVICIDFDDRPRMRRLVVQVLGA